MTTTRRKEEKKRESKSVFYGVPPASPRPILRRVATTPLTRSLPLSSQLTVPSLPLCSPLPRTPSAPPPLPSLTEIPTYWMTHSQTVTVLPKDDDLHPLFLYLLQELEAREPRARLYLASWRRAYIIHWGSSSSSSSSISSSSHSTETLDEMNQRHQHAPDVSLVEYALFCLAFDTLRSVREERFLSLPPPLSLEEEEEAEEKKAKDEKKEKHTFFDTYHLRERDAVLTDPERFFVCLFAAKYVLDMGDYPSSRLYMNPVYVEKTLSFVLYLQLRHALMAKALFSLLLYLLDIDKRIVRYTSDLFSESLPKFLNSDQKLTWAIQWMLQCDSLASPHTWRPSSSSSRFW